MVDATHPVERVRDRRHTLLHPVLNLAVGGVGMPRHSSDAAAAQLVYQPVRVLQFWGNNKRPDHTRVQILLNLLSVNSAQKVLGMRTLLFRVKERTLHIDAENI